jgi:hypothetical protein
LVTVGRDDRLEDDPKAIVFSCGSRRLLFGHDCKPYPIEFREIHSDAKASWCTFDSLGEGVGVDGNSLVEKDLGDRGYDEWWFLDILSQGSTQRVHEWTLINYEEKRMYNGTFHSCWVWDDPWDVRSSQDINPNPRGRPVTPDGGMLLLLKDFRSLGFGTPPKFDTRPLTNKIALPFTESKSGLSLADYQN